MQLTTLELRFGDPATWRPGSTLGSVDTTLSWTRHAGQHDRRPPGVARPHGQRQQAGGALFAVAHHGRRAPPSSGQRSQISSAGQVREKDLNLSRWRPRDHPGCTVTGHQGSRTKTHWPARQPVGENRAMERASRQRLESGLLADARRAPGQRPARTRPGKTTWGTTSGSARPASTPNAGFSDEPLPDLDTTIRPGPMAATPSPSKPTSKKTPTTN